MHRGEGVSKGKPAQWDGVHHTLVLAVLAVLEDQVDPMILPVDQAVVHTQDRMGDAGEDKVVDPIDEQESVADQVVVGTTWVGAHPSPLHRPHSRPVDYVLIHHAMHPRLDVA